MACPSLIRAHCCSLKAQLGHWLITRVSPSQPRAPWEKPGLPSRPNSTGTGVAVGIGVGGMAAFGTDARYALGDVLGACDSAGGGAIHTMNAATIPATEIHCQRIA